MSLEEEAFNEAFKDCLKNCFTIYSESVPDKDDKTTPEERFRTCCEMCRKARKVAGR